MAYTPSLNGGRLNAGIAGNTTGNSSAHAVSTGTVVFAGGTNVTLSQSTGVNGATISFNAGGGGVQSLSMYGVGNTAQSSAATLDARSVSLNGLGAMSVGYSGGSVQLSAPAVSTLNGAGIVSISTAGSNITLSAPAYSAGMSSIGNTSGTTGLATNQLVLAGGNNITLSQSTGAGGNTVSIIGGAGGGGGGVALYDGVHSITSGTASIQASGALTVSITNQTLSLSVPAVSTLNGAGAVSVSSAGSGITISAPQNGTLSNWEPLPLQNASLTTGSLGNASLHFFNLQPEAYITATQLMQLASMSFSSSSNSSHAGTLSLMAGIFTANGSTLSLITQSSGSASYAWTNTSNNSTASLSGIRGLTLPMNVNLSPGNYWLGMWSSSASAGSAYSMRNMLAPASGTYSGQLGQAVNATKGVLGGVGYYSSSTGAMPGSVPMSSIIQTNIGSNALPYIAFINQTW